MKPSDYSYLDLTVMPFLRKRVISSNAAILFNLDFSKVLWTNAMGTELFGGDDIYSVLDLKLSANHPLIRQLVNAARQIDENGPIVRGFRVARGLKSDLIQAELSRISLPNDDNANLLVLESNHKTRQLKEHELAAMAVDALEGFADAAAIVDEYGLILASTHGFDRLEIDPDTLETLIEIVAEEDDRLVKRKVETMSGNIAVAGLGRIRDVPGRFLVVIADASEEESETPASEPDLTEADDTQSNLGQVAPAPQIHDEELITDLDETDSETAQDMATPPQEVLSAAAAEQNEPADENAATAESGEFSSASLLDRWYFSDEDAGTVDEAPVEIEAEVPESQAIDTIDEFADEAVDEDRSASPVRFAFAIDQNQIVQSVSDELIREVGSISGDIVGKNWEELAAERHFDQSGTIFSLLKKADTWSGKSVLWPIDDTDMVVPVDLAALPVFDRERNFDGFKGFGIIRINDAIVDPSDSNFQNSDDNSDSDVSLGASSWRTDLAEEDHDLVDHETGITEEIESGEATETPQPDLRPLSDNVFRLPTRGQLDVATENDHLSGTEQQAFSEISRSLADQIEDEHRGGNDEPLITDSGKNSDTGLNQDEEKPPLRSASILQSLPIPMIIYQGDKTLFANQSLLELTGYASTEELAENGGVSALLGGDDMDDEAGGNGSLLTKKDGSVISVNSKLTSVDWYGEKALCLTFSETVEESPENDIALDIARVSELENILETAADGILVFDANGKVDSLNASGEALFGRKQSDVAGNSFGKLFATESREALETYINDLNAPGVSSVLHQGLQVIGLEANGGLIPLFATIGKVGKSDRYCAVLRDLTEWKKSEEELVTAKRNAETANEQKTEFLSRISHEIREPLTAIIGFSDVMIEERFGKIDNERYRGYLRDINRSGIHVLDLVNDLLDISKIEAGKLELSYEAVDLNKLAAETVALLQPQANNKRILIRTSLSRAVPKVVADARSIRQIILNLVSNAINHSPVNSQVIVSTTFEENSEVGLRIRDTGPGMTKEELESAIEPFSQVGDERMNKAGGTGLGLPLTKALVEANRAYFELESNPGEGTIAHIQFPSQRVLAD